MIKYLDLKQLNGAYDREIRQAIDEVLQRGWYLRGEATHRFERHYAEYIGTRHCVGVANGLDALTLILRAYIDMGVMQPGDEVLVPANTFIASVLAITENGLVPVFVEPDAETLQMDDTLIEQALTPRTRAIMLVHLYGRCAYTERIATLCQRYGLKLIEDNAQAHGCLATTPEASVATAPEASVVTAPEASASGLTSASRKTGSLGDAAGHSFYPGKNLGALGDAGAVTTNDAELAARVAALGNYGSTHKYIHDVTGRNSRIDDLQAAILDVKLHHLEADNQRRKEVAAQYINKVKNPLLRIPQSDRDCVYHIFPVFCLQRDALQEYLKEHGIETQIHYPIPPHKQQCYRQWNSVSLPVAERLSREELSLPCNQAMTDADVIQVVNLLNTFSV